MNGFAYAGFWRRFAAACIDMLAYTPLYILLHFFFPHPSWFADLLFLPLALLSYAWFFASPKQGTPGMWLMQFKVVTPKGNRISYRRALYWGVTSTVGWLFAGAGILYLQTRYNLDAVNHCLAAQRAGSAIHCDNAFGPNGFRDYLFWSLIALGSFLGLSFIWSLSIGLSKEKSGFHNVICGTRFVKN